MDADIITNFQGMVHETSLIVLTVVIVVTLVALSKPQLFQKFFHESGKRRYVLAVGVFLSLLCGTVFIATQPSGDKTYVSENNQDTASLADPEAMESSAAPEMIKVEDVTINEPVAHPKERRNDDGLPAGQTKITQAGKDGQKAVTYTLTYDKGKEVSRVLKSATVTLKPIPEIIAVGTRKNHQAARPANPAHPDRHESGRRFLPQINLNCKNNRDSEKSGIRICL